MRPMFALILTLLAAPPAALAQAGLEAEPAIREGLIAVGIAVEISDRCDRIEARRLKGIAYLNALRGEARRLGYSEAEIEAFLDDDAAADRLEAEARARLAAMGAVRGDDASHCRVGAAEIAAGSVIGQFLR
ncbi:DUF5333 family protein [Histidinibacterium lentulum]|nr:DUF5333 family protein [Histidinibacterium lentulum]